MRAVAGVSELIRFERFPAIRPHLLLGAIILWSLVTTPTVFHVAQVGDRWWALGALSSGPIAFVVRHRPVAAAAVLVIGATLLRLAFVGWTFSDPLEISAQASDRALAGFDPYGGFVYDQGRTAAVYPYGPLGLVTYRLGIPAEMLAVLGTSAVLIWQRAWLTLAFFNAWPQFLLAPAIGNNDFSVGFVLLGSLVLLPSRPKLAMALLAAAIAIKPYAAAWLLPGIGFAGASAGLIGLATSVICWFPVLFIWGPPSFAASVHALEATWNEQATLDHSSWAFADVPFMRLLAFPIGLAGLLVRSWRGVLLTGSLVFVVFLGFAPSAHAGYLGALIPVLGLALESPRNPGSRR